MVDALVRYSSVCLSRKRWLYTLLASRDEDGASGLGFDFLGAGAVELSAALRFAPSVNLDGEGRSCWAPELLAEDVGAEAGGICNAEGRLSWMVNRSSAALALASARRLQAPDSDSMGGGPEKNPVTELYQDGSMSRMNYSRDASPACVLALNSAEVAGACLGCLRLPWARGLPAAGAGGLPLAGAAGLSLAAARALRAPCARPGAEAEEVVLTGGGGGGGADRRGDASWEAALDVAGPVASSTGRVDGTPLGAGAGAALGTFSLPRFPSVCPDLRRPALRPTVGGPVKNASTGLCQWYSA